MSTQLEREQWQGQIEQWRVKGYLPHGTNASGIWHDCAWVERTADLLAHQPNLTLAAYQGRIAKLEARIEKLRSCIEAFVADCPCCDLGLPMGCTCQGRLSNAMLIAALTADDKAAQEDSQ